MVPPDQTITAPLPPLRPWSKNSHASCRADAIPRYWSEFGALTFLADTGMYSPSLLRGLDDAERERVLGFKSEYFKKRFVVSRSLLKSILRYIPGTGNPENLFLFRKNRRIFVPGVQDLFISLSYSGNCIALSVAKRKIGTDIETVQPADLGKIRSSPLFNPSKCKNKKEGSIHSLHLWTLVEAYAKLRDRNPYPLLNSSSLLTDAGFVSYCIDRKFILSLAQDTGTPDHALFWIDPEPWSSGMRSDSRLLSPILR